MEPVAALVEAGIALASGAAGVFIATFTLGRKYSELIQTAKYAKETAEDAKKAADEAKEAAEAAVKDAEAAAEKAREKAETAADEVKGELEDFKASEAEQWKELNRSMGAIENELGLRPPPPRPAPRRSRPGPT